MTSASQTTATAEVDFLADGLRDLTREDAAILAGLSAPFRMHYYYGDRKDAILMEKARLERELARTVREIVRS
jgi:hypothetical protein